MVYRGPSTGCGTCRHRRVKCDERKPSCLNCEKRSIFCTGYDRSFDKVHRDQSATVRRKCETSATLDRIESALVFYADLARSPTPLGILDNPWFRDTEFSPSDVAGLSVYDKRVLSVISSVPRSMNKTFENDSTDMFLNIFCGINANKKVSVWFMHYLPPLLNKTSCNSPLHKAVSAVAVNMAALWSMDPNSSRVHCQYYAQAINSLRETLSHSDRGRDDDVLMAVLILDFCDSINAHFRKDGESTMRSHQTGALALVNHRGTGNFKNETSKAMISSLQNGLITTTLQNQTSLPHDSQIWFKHPQMPHGVGTELDNITIPLVELLSRARLALQYPSRGRSKICLAHLQKEFLQLDKCYINWHKELSKDFEPRLVWGHKIPERVIRAGIYRDQCSVYADLNVAHMQNLWRLRRVKILHMLKECTLALQTDEDISEQFVGSDMDQTIQKLVDEVCDSIPFFLGDYLDKVPPLQHSMLTFPVYEDENGTIPAEPKHHAWHATCAGGWLCLSSLVELSDLIYPQDGTRPLVLRAGQKQWVGSQLSRLDMAWKLPPTSSPPKIAYLDSPSEDGKDMWVSLA